MMDIISPNHRNENKIRIPEHGSINVMVHWPTIALEYSWFPDHSKDWKSQFFYETKVKIIIKIY